ncbi:hypothetical protein AWU65_14410 [Paenibacillus glucanolyticus]|uniref:MFS transporter n=1 Tax=Paenibacillus glucanolyticus TaxID=59843 RepID=A0A162EKN3_9BACL|nr:MFS transporter [Paenibacillus glucanolyticus]KZS47031.1 hypothetical protein AWU65_14410 [Paenibacillus glucanolyticus]
MLNKNILTLLVARIFSNISDSLYAIASIWYIKEATGSPLWVGVAGGVLLIPRALQFLFGPVIDGFPKKRILLVCEATQAIIFILISISFFTNTLDWRLLLLFIFIGEVFAQLSYPTEEALVPSLVSEKELTKVNSIFTFTYNGLDMIGNALSGLIILFLGIGLIFTLNALSFIAIFLIVFFFLKLPKTLSNYRLVDSEENHQHLSNYKRELRDGIVYLYGRKRLMKLLYSFIFINFIVTISISILPIIETSVARYGYWMGAMSIGMVIGSLIVNYVARYNLRKVLIWLSFLCGISWLGTLTFLNNNFIVALFFFTIVWSMIGTTQVLLETIIQINVELDYLGRSNTVIGTFLSIFTPLGYFLGGILATLVSPQFLFLLSAIAYFCVTLYYLFEPNFKRYVSVDEAFEEIDSPIQQTDSIQI